MVEVKGVKDSSGGGVKDSWGVKGGGGLRVLVGVVKDGGGG